MGNPCNGIRCIVAILLMVGITGCSRPDPNGQFAGVMKDWVHEVFTGIMVTGGWECEVRLELSQMEAENRARLLFSHPQMDEVERMGSWKLGDGERLITFEDDKSPSEYFLIKRGVRYAFQTKQGLYNDDGSSLLLIRNEGISRKASFPIEIGFGPGDQAEIKGHSGNADLQGSWNWMGERIAVTVKLPELEREGETKLPQETNKYILRWSEKRASSLELEKIVIMRPFLKEDGSKRQSWMSSLIFPDPPLLRAK